MSRSRRKFARRKVRRVAVLAFAGLVAFSLISNMFGDDSSSYTEPSVRPSVSGGQVVKPTPTSPQPASTVPAAPPCAPLNEVATNDLPISVAQLTKMGWVKGDPIKGEDVLAPLRRAVDPAGNDTSRIGWEAIARENGLGDALGAHIMFPWTTCNAPGVKIYTASADKIAQSGERTVLVTADLGGSSDCAKVNKCLAAYASVTLTSSGPTALADLARAIEPALKAQAPNLDASKPINVQTEYGSARGYTGYSS